jgi:Thioesterase-like superfamily
VTAAAAVHAFDADTALEHVAEGRRRAYVPAHWLVARGANGGFLAAVAARAAEATAARPLRSLALHSLAAPGTGPLDVAAVVERAGRTTSVVSLRLEREGRAQALGLATLSELPASGLAWDVAEMPAARPPEDVPAMPRDAPGAPAFMANYDMRWALPGGGPGEPVTGGWLRTAASRALDAPLVAAMTDAWAPAAFAAAGRFLAAPTLDLTIHIRRPLPPADVAPEQHVLGRFSTRLAVGGVWEEDGELWAPDGRLLAQSRQLALAREL